MISLLVAMDRNRVIGYKNDLPWHLPKDLRFFKEKTTGGTIIMGRKTFESIGRVLPKREHVVLTKQGINLPEEVKVISDVSTVMDLNRREPEKEFFVIGGGNIFSQVMPYADRMYITWIDEPFEGDTFFPDFSNEDWHLTSREKGETDEKNPYDYYFLQYDRK
ncbi:dihydrofolate reductase [Virgibacillus oceani]